MSENLPSASKKRDWLMNRVYGLPVQVTNENIVENRKQILEVRWMAPDRTTTAN
jgi:hypothetical protein